MQSMIDAMNSEMQDSRRDYHLTLGGAIDKLAKIGPKLIVRLSDKEAQYPGELDSYRGYYCDLAFRPSLETITAGELRHQCEAAIGQTFIGYKGGDYVMQADTPLWISEYGESSRRAITDLIEANGFALLVVKTVAY